MIHNFFFNNGDYGINGHYTIPSIPYLKILPRFRYYHNDMGWLRGHLKQMNTYKKDGDKFTLVKSIENNYKEFDKHQFIVGFNVFRLVADSPLMPLLPDQPGRVPWPPETVTPILPLPPHPMPVKEFFQWHDLKAQTGIVKLMQTKETNYLDNNEIVQSTTYIYDRITDGYNHYPISPYEKPNGPTQLYELTSSQQINSDGSIIKKRLKYPYDVLDGISQKMIEKNILSKVIIETDSVDNKFIQEIHNEYRTMSNGMLVPYKTNIRKETGASETEATYNYDNQMSLLSYIQKDGSEQTFIWGHNKTLVMAKLDNISPTSVTAAGMAEFFNQLESYTDLSSPATRDNLKRLNQTIRDRFSSLNVQISTYTYKPLVGMTSMTDPTGLTTYYAYDYIGRLIRVYQIDENSQMENTIEEYNYYYRQP